MDLRQSLSGIVEGSLYVTECGNSTEGLRDCNAQESVTRGLVRVWDSLISDGREQQSVWGVVRGVDEESF